MNGFRDITCRHCSTTISTEGKSSHEIGGDIINHNCASAALIAAADDIAARGDVGVTDADGVSIDDYLRKRAQVVKEQR